MKPNSEYTIWKNEKWYFLCRVPKTIILDTSPCQLFLTRVFQMELVAYTLCQKKVPRYARMQENVNKKGSNWAKNWSKILNDVTEVIKTDCNFYNGSWNPPQKALYSSKCYKGCHVPYLCYCYNYKIHRDYNWPIKTFIYMYKIKSICTVINF